MRRLIDPALHALAAALAVAPVALWPRWWVAGLVWMVAGYLREIEQHRWQIHDAALYKMPHKMPGWLDRRVLARLRTHWRNDVAEAAGWGVGAAVAVEVVRLWS